MDNIIVSNARFIVIDIIGDFIYWPIWWYTLGLKDRLQWFGGQVKGMEEALALGLWLRNFFVPMYADRSILGRGISLVTRIIILAWKLIWFLAWTALVFLAVLAWIFLPVAAVYMICIQF